MTALQKTSLIYRFTCKRYVCYFGHVNQRLEIRINQHILSNIRTYTFDYTRPSSYHSTSAISCCLLVNQTRACVNSPTMLTLLKTSTNELLLSILEALLIKKYKPELCIQKQSYTSLLFYSLLGPPEENIIDRINSAGLQSFFYNMFFFSPLLDLLSVTTLCLLSPVQNRLSLTIL